MLRVAFFATALAALPLGASAEIRVTEGFILDNMARQV